MSTYKTFIVDALYLAKEFSDCTEEQALPYACEIIAENNFATREFKSRDIDAWVDAICQREDLDTPHIVVQRASSAALASAHIEDQLMCIRGKSTTAATVLHELAHLSVGAHNHGVLFRDELVRLCRAHISVDYAAMLHGLFSAIGLEMSPWPASAARR